MLMARDGLRTKLRAAIHKAIRKGEPVAVADVQVKRNGVFHPMTLTVKPVQGPKDAEVLVLVIFQDVPNTSIRFQPRNRPREDTAVRQLETNSIPPGKTCKAPSRRLENSNEELKASNEEMMSMNEELQSANEELETSKEEMQSLNEELSTVNSQLHEKVDQLETAEQRHGQPAEQHRCPDLVSGHWFPNRAIHAGDHAVVQPDCHGHWPAHQRHRVQMPRSHAAAGYRAGAAHPHAAGERSSDCGRLLVDPAYALLTARCGKQVEGVVLAYSDITHLRRTDEQARRLATVLVDSNDAVTIHDFDGQITAWNRGAERMYGYTEAEAIRMNARQMIPEEAAPRFSPTGRVYCGERPSNPGKPRERPGTAGSSMSWSPAPRSRTSRADLLPSPRPSAT